MTRIPIILERAEFDDETGQVFFVLSPIPTGNLEALVPSFRVQVDYPPYDETQPPPTKVADKDEA